MFQSQDDQDNFESFTPATQDCYSYDQAPGGQAQNINSFSPLRKKNRHNPVFQYMPSQGNSQLDGPMISGDGDSSNEGQFQPHGGAFLLSQDSQFNFSQLSQFFRVYNRGCITALKFE